MAKSTNKEVSRAEYACRKMRKIINEKSLEIDKLTTDLNNIKCELRDYRDSKPIYYQVVVICSVLIACMSLWINRY